MKKLLSLLISLSLISCGSTYIPLGDREVCALEGEGYSPTGVTTGTSSSSYINFNTGNVVGGSTVSRNLSCSKAPNKYEECLSEKLKSSGAVIVEYNKGKKTRELWTGIAYVFWIIPGVIGMLINNSDNENEMKKVTQIRDDAQKACEQFKSKTANNIFDYLYYTALN